MQAPTLLHVLETPLADGGGILAEHAFAGAGNVAEDEVECHLRLAEVTGIVVGNDAVWPTPLGDVLQKDLGPCRYRLVAHEDAALGQDGAHGGGLTAGGSAEVEDVLGSEECGVRSEITQFPEDVGDKQGGSFLDVVAAGMEEGVEGELGTTREVVAFGTPGDSFSRKEEGGMRNVFFEERGRRKEEGNMF